jgi:hypothetical protein
MSDLILEQFGRLLDGLDPASPWPGLEESGFLDLLLGEDEGGAGLQLGELFDLALETGRRPGVPPIVESMAARLKTPGANNVADLEATLASAGVDAMTAKSLAAAIAAARMAGAMEQVQAMTVDYATTRQQFGREIGKFQAVQHQIAVMAEEVTAARMAAQIAFQGAPLEIAPTRAAVAKMRAGQAAQTVCSVAHAVHGAIGVSQEHVLHRFTGQLHQWRLAHGGEGYWARQLGRWTLESAADPVSLVRAI